ncbi:MAG: hypothetical protein WAQ24_02190 [Candidatus Saccharimonadales bacterium]
MYETNSPHVDPTALLRGLAFQQFSPSARVPNGPLERLSRYDAQHANYLDGMGRHLLVSLPQGARANMLSEGEGRVGVVIAGTRNKDSQVYDIGSRIDLEHMGLPRLEGDVVGLAFSKDKEGSVLIEAYALDSKKETLGGRLAAPGVERYVLENHTAAVHGANYVNGTESQWYRPGHCLLPHGNLQPTVEVRKTKEHAVSEIIFTPAQDVETILVTAPTAEESKRSKALSPEDAKSAAAIARRKLRQKAGALVAAAVFGGLASPSPVDNPGERVTSANTFVHPTGQGVAEIAESSHDAAVVARSKAAFEAYARGNVLALTKQSEDLGYTANWITEEAIRNVKSANSFSELSSAFAAVSQGGKVKLTTISAPEVSKYSSKNEVIRPLVDEDLEAAKLYAADILTVLNSLDKKFVSEQEINIAIAKGIDNSKGSNSNVDPVGLYDAKKNVIILATEDVHSISGFVIGDGEDIFRHELVHQIDIHSNKNAISAKVTNVGSSYKGEAYKSAEVNRKGTPIFLTNYAAYNPSEDAAETGAHLLGEKPIELSQSPRDEKLQTVLFSLEKEMPGFTAHWLERARPSFYHGSVLDAARYVVGEFGGLIPEHKKPGLPFAPAGLALAVWILALISSRRAEGALETSKLVNAVDKL